MRSTYMKLLLRKSRNEQITDIIHGKLEYMVLLTEMNVTIRSVVNLANGCTKKKGFKSRSSGRAIKLCFYLQKK